MTWRCFHCDDVFTKHTEAAAHFGYQVDATPACKIAPDLRGMVQFMRRQEGELQRFRREDSDASRQFYALGAEHAAALRTEEEKGYARGLRDANYETVRAQTIEECAVSAEAQDRSGYEWVRNSLWAVILRRAGANVRGLNIAAPSDTPHEHQAGCQSRYFGPCDCATPLSDTHRPEGK